MKKAIINTTIVMPDYLIPSGVIVIEDGKMVGLGTHKELAETCTLYQELIQLQLGGA
jgi:ABC-type transport system involved in Fe-S cluster assembly fused permease/ATPase subunit